MAAGVGFSLAGCTSTLPPLGQRVRFGRVDMPSADPPAYRNWLPASGADGGGLHTGRPADLPAGTFGRGHLATLPDWLGAPLEAYDRAVDVGPAYVFDGGPDRGTVADALAGTGYVSARRSRGFDWYARSDGPRHVAVTDGAAIWARGDRARSAIESVIDADAGRVDRRHEVDPDFAALSAAVGETHFDVFGGINVSGAGASDAVLSSFSQTYDGDALYIRSQYLYDEATAVPEGAIKRELRSSGLAVDADAVDVRSEGRRAIVELRTAPDDEDWRTPLVTWGGAFDAEQGSVTLAHEAGEAVAAGDLTVSVRGPDGTRKEPEHQFDDVHGTVESGDELSVAPVSVGSTVHLRFEPTTNRGSTLFRYRTS